MRASRSVATTVVALLVATPVWSAAKAPPAEPTKNVLLVLLDTVRQDRLGCLSGKTGLTPEMDRFAAGAVRFERAYAHAPWTLPSLASLYTSRYPSQHGAGGRLGHFTSLPEDVPTLPEAFARAGAETAGVLNVHYLGPTFGMARGLQTVDLAEFTSNEKSRRAAPTTDAALARLDALKASGKPFFLVVHYFDAHLVYDPPPAFRKRFADPSDREGSSILFGSRSDMSGLRSGEFDLPPDLLRRLEKMHDAEVAYVDAEVGRLLAGLTQRGLDDRTVVVITADHGEEFGEHGGFEHGHTLHDELLRVPLLVRAPGVGKPATVRSIVRLVDVAPTLRELCGLPPDPGSVGESLRPLLTGASRPDRPVLAQGNFWGAGAEALVSKGAKVIRQLEGGDVQLYDLQSDPGEKADLAMLSLPRRAEMLRDLDLVLRTARARAAPGPEVTLSDEEKSRLKALGYLE